MFDCTIFDCIWYHTLLCFSSCDTWGLPGCMPRACGIERFLYDLPTPVAGVIKLSPIKMSDYSTWRATTSAGRFVSGVITRYNDGMVVWNRSWWYTTYSFAGSWLAAKTQHGATSWQMKLLFSDGGNAQCKWRKATTGVLRCWHEYLSQWVF